MDKLGRIKPQMECDQRFQATQERNSLPNGNWYQRKTLNGIVHCRHGLDPDCPCAQNFQVDKSRSLTEQEAKVGAASYGRSEMERNNQWDTDKFRLLSEIIKCTENEQKHHINQYESIYGPLLTEYIFKIDHSVAHLQ
jgi:hypothetical protein